jgi:hypothetical protein
MSTYIQYNITTGGFGSSTDACATTNLKRPIFADPSYTIPIVTMIFYDDPALLVPYNGGFSGQWNLLEKSGVTWAAVINNTGELLNILECTVPTTPTQTPSNTPTETPDITPTQTQTQTQTQTPSQTKTPSQTPTQTKTPSQTPTQTPSQTNTPSLSGVICGYGLTTGTYYYTDCCGNLIQGTQEGIEVSLDYTKVSSGVLKLNTPAPVTCPSPTPSQTPTFTPTNTTTPKFTPTTTQTPTMTPSTTVTPSRSGVFVLKNECDVFTLFDMGVECNVIASPSSSTSNDGILSLNVTGGTSPYSFYWDNGQRSQTLTSVGAGVYECTVVDYYGDYTATTICTLLAPTATPTPSVSVTPTMTPSAPCPNLCFIALYESVSYGPWQFVCNGMFNGKTTWNYNGYNIVWTGVRWEIVGSDMTTPFVAANGGIFASNSTSSTPLNGWASVGGNYEFKVIMTQGNCPTVIPLQTKVTFENSTCNGVKGCDGTITISAFYGQPPYIYSINNGLSWQSNGLFFGLCPSTYTIITKDSLNNTVNNTVTLGFNQPPTTYQLSVNLLANQTQVVTGPNLNSTTTYLNVTSNPPIPAGVTVQFNLNFTSVKTTNGPGTGNLNDTILVYQNGNLIGPSVQQSPQTVINSRPNCSPENQEVTTETETYSCTLTNTSTITITTQSALAITNGQIATNSCATNLNQTIFAGISSQIIQGCSCCAVVADTNLLPAVSNSVNYVQSSQEIDCPTAQGQILEGTGIFLDMDLLVGGITCTGDGIDCSQNFRYSDTNPAGILTDNGVVSSYVCGIPSRSGIQQVRAYFQVPTNGSYAVGATIYLNNNIVGQGYFVGYVTTMDYPQIIVDLPLPITISNGDTFKVVYGSAVQ